MKEGHMVKLNKCTSDHFNEPVVITAKKDGSIKLAMDAKPMNAQFYKNKYEMPYLLKQLEVAAQIINSKISGPIWFTSLDLKYAFSQLQLSDLVSSHCNFNIVCEDFTGTYRFNPGFYDLTDMPKKLQKARDNTLQNIPGVICFLDDTLIVSKGSIEDHNKTIERVFQKLEREGFALKLSKCVFLVRQITWLGYDIDDSGYIPKNSKVQRVLDLKAPRTLKQLRSYMGVVDHLQKLLLILQLYTEKFRSSLKFSNKTKIIWNEYKQDTFNKSLKVISEITKMYYYDQKRKSRIKCDASHSGLGESIEQELSDGTWAPIAFA